MRSLPSRALYWLSWFHRWTGIALCLLFALWFASGAVLIFVPFPALSDRDRLAASEPVDLSGIRIAPARALAAAGGGESLRVVSADGRPLYVVGGPDGRLRAVDARTGLFAPPIDRIAAARIAGRFGSARVRSVSGPVDYDQWVVHQGFDPSRPFFRVALDDRQGTELYVSARTGEVVQRTRTVQRAWNWPGAITHWIYFTALRRSFTAWDQTVWWVSLFGLATAVVGVFLGVYRTQKTLNRRRPDWSPFRGWLRWHHGLGLGAAVFVLTWIFSGWLSMDHGRLFSRGEPESVAVDRYHGARLGRAFEGIMPAKFAGFGPTTQLDLGVVAARPFVVAEHGVGSAQVRLLDRPGTQDSVQLPAALLADAMARAWPIASRTPVVGGKADELYREAEDMDPRIVSFPLAPPRSGAVYVDPVSGRLVVVMDPSRKAYAWVYYALHTFKFPGLIDHPALREGLALLLAMVGFGFSVTGVVIGIKRLRLTAR